MHLRRTRAAALGHLQSIPEHRTVRRCIPCLPATRSLSSLCRPSSPVPSSPLLCILLGSGIVFGFYFIYLFIFSACIATSCSLILSWARLSN